MKRNLINFLTRTIKFSPISAKTARVFGAKIIYLIHSVDHVTKDFKTAYKSMVEISLEASRDSRPILDMVEECIINLENIPDPLAQATLQVMKKFFADLEKKRDATKNVRPAVDMLDRPLNDLCEELEMK